MAWHVSSRGVLFWAADAAAVVARALEDGVLTTARGGALVQWRLADVCHSAVWRVWLRDDAARASAALAAARVMTTAHDAFTRIQRQMDVPLILQLPYATARAICDVLRGTAAAVPSDAWAAAAPAAAAAWRSLVDSDPVELLGAVLEEDVVVPLPALLDVTLLVASGSQLYPQRAPAQEAATRELSRSMPPASASASVSASAVPSTLVWEPPAFVLHEGSGTAAAAASDAASDEVSDEASDEASDAIALPFIYGGDTES